MKFKLLLPYGLSSQGFLTGWVGPSTQVRLAPAHWNSFPICRWLCLEGVSEGGGCSQGQCSGLARVSSSHITDWLRGHHLGSMGDRFCYSALLGSRTEGQGEVAL